MFFLNKYILQIIEECTERLSEDQINSVIEVLTETYSSTSMET